MKKTVSSLYTVKYSSLSTLCATIIAILVLFTLFTKYALPVRDGDLFFHLAYGKYFLTNHTIIPDHTVFSWSPSSNDTIYCTWLGSLLLYLIYTISGFTGLFIFRYLCLGIIILCAYDFATRANIHKSPFTWFLTLIAVLLSYTAAFIKPEILTFSYLTVLCWLWWTIKLSNGSEWKKFYLIPLVMILWVNSHGGVVFGYALLAVITLGEILNILTKNSATLPPQTLRHFFYSLILSFASLFINPYGYHYPLQLAYDFMPSSDNVTFILKIGAYQSPFTLLSDFQRFHFYPNLAIVSLLILYASTYKKIEWSSLLSNLLFAFLYTKFFRTTFYLAPVILFASLYQLSLFYNFSSIIRRFNYLRPFGLVFLMIFSTVLATDSFLRSLKSPEIYQWMGFGVSHFNPVEETKYIQKYFPDAIIGNTYDQGAYLLWKRWPKHKVFFDARHFPYRGWSDEFFHCLERGNNLDQFLQKYKADLWLVSMRDGKTLLYFENSPDWKRVYYGKNSVLYLNSNQTPPVHSPAVSETIDNLKNPSTSYYVLTAACHFQDWATAEILVNAIEQKFETNDVSRWARPFVDGMNSYFHRDYIRAVEQLEKADNKHSSTKIIRSASHNTIAAQLYATGDFEKSLYHVRQAWDLVPGNVFSLYNAGILSWHLAQEDPENLSSLHLNDQSWRNYLQLFMNITQQTDSYTLQREIASDLLKDSMDRVEGASLIFPPEPNQPAR